MKKETKFSKKLIALLLSALMLATMIPVSLLTVFAESKDSVTVTIVDSLGATIEKAGSATLTNKSDTADTETVDVIDGVATFDNAFAYDTKTFTLSVSDVVGYENFTKDDVSFASDDNCNAELTELPKITVTGTVVDEKDAAYSAKGTFTCGDGSYDTEVKNVTWTDNAFSFEIYNGKSYSVTYTPADEKYKAVEIIKSADSTAADILAGEQKLSVKTFDITTTAGENGTITANQTLDYNASTTITATADSGFRIDSFKVDDVEKADAKGQQSYDYQINNIKANHTVKVTFVAKTYEVSFNVSNGGNVTYNTSNTAEGGKVTPITVNENGTVDFTAVANTTNGYHVESVKVGDDVILADGNNSNSTQDGTVPAVTKDVTVVVVFALNQYNLSFSAESDTTNGTAKIMRDENEVTTVDYGTSDFYISVMPNANYYVKSVQFKDVKDTTWMDTVLKEQLSDGTCNYILPTGAKATADMEFKVIYGEISNGNIDEVLGHTTIKINDIAVGALTQEEIDKVDAVKGSLYSVEEAVDASSGITTITYYFIKGTTVSFSSKTKNIDLQVLEDYKFAKNAIKPINIKQNNYSNKKHYIGYCNNCSISQSITLTNIQADNSATGDGSTAPDEQATRYRFVIDNTAPIVSDIPEQNWTNKSVTISGSVTDNLDKDGNADATNPSSGIAKVVYGTDNDYSKATNDATLKADGTYSFNVSGAQDKIYYVYAVDNAGNVSDAKMVEVKIDATRPTITVEKKPSSDWTNGDVTISGNVADNSDKDGNPASGVAKVVYGTDNDYSKATNDATLKADGTYSFNVSGAQDKIYYVYAVDNAGNVSDAKMVEVKIDATRPTITVEKKPSSDWTNGDVTISGNVADNSDKDGNPASGVAKVVYGTDNDYLKATNNATLNADGTYSFTVDNTTEQDQIYYVYAVDNAGNVSDPISSVIKIDTTAPTVDHFEFEEKNDSKVAKFFNNLTFGLFFNEEIKVTATFSDSQGNFNSEFIGGTSVAKISFVDDVDTKTFTDVDVNVVKLATGEYQATATISPDDFYKGNVFAVVTDRAGNTSEKTMATEGNSNLKDELGFIMLETKAPEARFTDEDQAGTWYNKQNVSIPFTVKDADSGIYSVDVSYNYNGEKDNKEELVYNTITNADKPENADAPIFNASFGIDPTATAKITEEKSFTVSVDNAIPYLGDGKYTVKVVVTDNAGNVTETEQTVYIDTTASAITNFELKKADGTAMTSESVVVTDYGYYFLEAATLTVTTTDAATTNDKTVADVSGVKEIEYYTVDCSDPANKKTSETTTILVGETISIPANFKGQIYVMPVDNLGNVPVLVKGTDLKLNDIYTEDYRNANGYKKDGYICPNGTIVENSSKHEEETHINISRAETALKTASGSDLYATKVPVTVTITDTYSGIRTADWSITQALDKEISGKIEIPKKNSEYQVNDTFVSGGITWTVIETDNNLVTRIQGKITVENNRNDITLSVNMADRAGNTSTDSTSFSIDKTAPAIAVSYDNNTPDAQNTTYFKADRTATVTVTERNFDASLVNILIANEHGVIPQLSAWTPVVVNDKDPDSNTYQATLLYSADGDYTFDTNCTDRATNANTAVTYGNSVSPTAFTIDKTAPTVSVAYDNNNSKTNSNFYDAQRIATITINEHDFDSSRVSVTGTADDDGTPIAFPTTSAWASSGDIHTATITYSADAKYNFDIAFNDMAGNSSADYAAGEFYVDNTNPEVTISGIAAGTSYNGKVSPIVTFFDKNFNPSAATFTLTGVKNGKLTSVAATATPTDNGNTYAITYLDSTVNPKLDDIYSLTATMTDLAGRTDSKTVDFSVNRFGSVYDLTSLSNLNGKYLADGADVTFTETNVNDINLDSIKVTLFTADSVGKTLVQGVDYTIEKISAAGQWSTYRYTIFAKNFNTDGKYTITVYSEDTAGNKNDSTNLSMDTDGWTRVIKDGGEGNLDSIEFVIDKVAPTIVSKDLDANKLSTKIGKNAPAETEYKVKYNKKNAESMTATFVINDNHIVDDKQLVIYVNDNPVEYSHTEGSTDYTVTLNKSNSIQNVKVVAVDGAGNSTELDASVRVTNNVLIRWYDNTVLFICTLAIIGLLIAAVIILIVVKKKKKDEEKTKAED